MVKYVFYIDVSVILFEKSNGVGPLFDNPTIPRFKMTGTIYHFNELHSDLRKNPKWRVSVIPVHDEGYNFIFPERISKKAFEDEQVKLILDMIVDFKEKTYQINDLRIDGSQIDAEGNFTQSTKKGRTKLSGELEVEYDMAQVSTLASGFIPQQLTMTGKRC